MSKFCKMCAEKPAIRGDFCSSKCEREADLLDRRVENGSRLHKGEAIPTITCRRCGRTVVAAGTTGGFCSQLHQDAFEGDERKTEAAEKKAEAAERAEERVRAAKRRPRPGNGLSRGQTPGAAYGKTARKCVARQVAREADEAAKAEPAAPAPAPAPEPAVAPEARIMTDDELEAKAKSKAKADLEATEAAWAEMDPEERNLIVRASAVTIPQRDRLASELGIEARELAELEPGELLELIAELDATAEAEAIDASELTPRQERRAARKAAVKNGGHYLAKA